MSDPKFTIGQIVHHKRFDYRGVVYDIDPEFSGTEQWYDEVAKSRPPKDQPWYHVLADGATHTTYAAEANLMADESPIEICHPLLEHFFSDFKNGFYLRNDRPWG